MENVNLELIDEFGVRNEEMADDAPNVTCDARTGRLWSYLEMRVFRNVVLPMFAAERRDSLRVLDVGAGTGRMTGELAKIAAHCVAIEPFPEFVKESCPVKKHNMGRILNDLHSKGFTEDWGIPVDISNPCVGPASDDEDLLVEVSISATSMCNPWGKMEAIEGDLNQEQLF